MPNTPSRSLKSTIADLVGLGHWSAISKAITAETGLTITAQEAYDVLYPEERHSSCGKEKRFISFSVGYRFCGKASVCQCAKAAVAAKVSAAKMSATTETKAEEKKKRAETNIARYGVANPLQLSPPRTISDAEKEKRKETNLARYGHAAAQSPDVRQKIADTNLARYGHSAAQSSEVREKCSNTLISRYGVDNPMKSEEIRRRAADTNLTRYGVANVSHSPEIVNKIRDSLIDHHKDGVVSRIDDYEIVGDYTGAKYRNKFRCLGCDNVFEDTLINGGEPRCKRCFPVGSIVETALAEHIENMGLEVVRNDRAVISPYELDIIVPSKKVAIEYCGLYWHSEERLGSGYHFDKMRRCNARGYRLVTIFEDEWISNPELVKERISHILGKQVVKYYARKLKVNEVPKLEAEAFLNRYHSQGSVKSPINFGLYDHGILVALMTFGKARFGGGEHYELVRYCSIGAVVGGASKLFTHFVRQYQPSEVMSYADRRWSDGGLYESIGFKLVSKTSPNYWYFKSKRREHRMNFMKSKLVKQGCSPELSEKEIMIDQGYGRIYDCGSFKYVWRNA